MSKLRVCSFGVSLDGFAAGPAQAADHPAGRGGEAVHQWAFATEGFKSRHGEDGGALGVDDDLFAGGFADIGAWIIGRNMFGPDRGPWGPDPWRGWWGETPPFGVPVFVLTRHARAPLALSGGTTFHFVTDGVEAALEEARAAAGGGDVRLGGGVSVVRQYARARLVDEFHLAVVPTLLGEGENLFQGLDLKALGYACTRAVPGEGATHVFITRLA